jgi:hypothetical protein
MVVTVEKVDAAALPLAPKNPLLLEVRLAERARRW